MAKTSKKNKYIQDLARAIQRGYSISKVLDYAKSHFQLSEKMAQNYLLLAIEKIGNLDIVQAKAAKVLYKDILLRNMIKVEEATDIRADFKMKSIVLSIQTLMKLDGLDAQKIDLTSGGEKIDMSTNVQMNINFAKNLEDSSDDEIGQLYEATQLFEKIKGTQKPPRPDRKSTR